MTKFFLATAPRTTDGATIGYSMPLVPRSEPLCKFFTKDYKNSSGVTPQMVVDLLRALQNEVKEAHSSGCLVVDLNELNVQVEPATNTTPWLIDVDSWQTKSHPATAIMESIRDPLVKDRKWSSGSDWFSFAVLAVQSYLNIHPYKGSFPGYKLNEWSKRRDDGVSVFTDGAKLPSMCNPFDVIPKSHREWLTRVLSHKERSEPPPPDGSVVVTKKPTMRSAANSKFSVTKIRQYSEKIIAASSLYGSVYVATSSQSSIKVYKDESLVLVKQAKPGSTVFYCVDQNGGVSR